MLRIRGWGAGAERSPRCASVWQIRQAPFLTPNIEITAHRALSRDLENIGFCLNSYRGASGAPLEVGESRTHIESPRGPGSLGMGNVSAKPPHPMCDRVSNSRHFLEIHLPGRLHWGNWRGCASFGPSAVPFSCASCLGLRANDLRISYRAVRAQSVRRVGTYRALLKWGPIEPC